MKNKESQTSKFNSQMTLGEQSRIITKKGTDVRLPNEISPEMAQMLDGHQSALTVALYKSLAE
ncbi:hypothetical protein [Acetohalobium arabaticum]|uniref:Uncharacterized protein n=1 Tax=Acetohalobium arabaticum (strain ATCC 49924 / DSM 5501 / Z-7288) TaxID=574087 RepID=D9QSL4_ACEAZ|nr:hypothetical protein [Acetohalobium arabaticum]ADL13477.1 hypothetical protein Acear_1980 [Acetohalobium arabaticum DSM 5501]